MPGQIRRAEHDLLQRDGDFTFAGVRLAQLVVQLFQIVRPGIDQGRDPCCLRTQRWGELTEDGGMHELRDVVGPRDDPLHPAVRPQDGAGHPAPPSLLEFTWAADDGNVESLRCHHIGLARVEHALE